jgi:endonuclease/exonuclease/phosphatase family metal-dependent hydrolase
MKKIVLAAAVALAGSAFVNPVQSVQAASSMNINVGSFNILSASVDRTSGNQRPWKDRRDTVVNQILDENIDVIGLQEANQSKFFADRTVTGTTQMNDVVAGLNARGAHYRLSNANGFNCVNSSTPYKCVYKYRAATGADRIVFNTDTLNQLNRGALKYSRQGSAFTSYLPWAVFQTKATGDKFIFASTHLTTGAEDIRRAQWNQLIEKLTALRSRFNAPVIVVGDFNTQKFSDLAATFLPRMKANGFGDVTGQVPFTNKLDRPRAQRYTNAWINSLNRTNRDVRDYSYYQDRTRAGNTIDWIFASNQLAVPEYKLVLNYGSDLQVNGTIPSDHNMLRATITLP